MGEGDSWEIVVPPHLAYGDGGRSSEQRGQYVHAGAVLVYILTIVKVRPSPSPSHLHPPRLSSPLHHPGHPGDRGARAAA